MEVIRNIFYSELSFIIFSFVLPFVLVEQETQKLFIYKDLAQDECICLLLLWFPSIWPKAWKVSHGVKQVLALSYSNILYNWF